MNTRNSVVRGLLLALVVALLSACAEKPEGLVKSAKENLAKGDQKAAVIQLRGALQNRPDLAEARYLLGTALLDTGDFPASEKELRKALELEYPADQVVPTLVRAMVAEGRFKEAIDEFGTASIGSPQGAAELQSALGQAFFATGNAGAGKAAFEAALAAQPDYPPAILGVARQKAAGGDLPGALASIEAVLAKSPKFAEGWVFKGELAMAQRQPDTALAAYRKAVEIRPDFLAVHSALVTLLIREGKADEAAAQLEAMKEIAPTHPQTLYLQGMLAYQRKDFAAAREALQPQLRAAPDYLPGLLLSGAVDFELGSYAAAELNLAKFLNAVPNHSFARRLLIRTYLESGQSAKALEALKPLLGMAEGRPALLAFAGEVYLRNLQFAEAAKYYSKALELEPKNSRGRLGLAVSHMAKGETDTAFQQLESAAAENSATQADFVLIRLALAQREFDKALAALDALEKKQPNTPLARNLRGVALLGKRDIAGARKSFEQSVALDAAYFPAAANLARLDLTEKKPEDAKKRFEAVLTKDPKNVAALLAIAELRARNGGSPEEVAALIDKAIAANPSAVPPRLALISHRLRTNDAKKAVTAGQDALAALPDNPEILRALGRAQLTSGDTNQALASYHKLVQLEPKSPLPLLLVAEVQIAMKNKDPAVQTLRKALALKSDLIEAQRGILMLDLDAGRTPQAVAMAREVQKQRPKEAIGYLLEGDVNAYTKSWTQAASAYRTGLKQVGTVDLALKLHQVLSAAGNAAEAEKVASNWVKEHPKDTAFRVYLAETAIAKGDFTTAAKHYRLLLELQPDNPMLLNNLAWTSGQIKDPKAIEYAEKANKLAPDQPGVLDTLGTLLVERGDKARGIEMLQKASKLAPESASIRLSLAKSLLIAGQKDAAKKELEELAKLGDKFKEHAEVEQLMKGI
jgi:putative PEP-CTERM system TPR-repeat lipoprotein